MGSFRIEIAPSRRAAARHVNAVRRTIRRVVAESGLSLTAIASDIDVHRAVLRRELDGRKDITLARVGELLWATRPSRSLDRGDGTGRDPSPLRETKEAFPNPHQNRE